MGTNYPQFKFQHFDTRLFPNYDISTSDKPSYTFRREARCLSPKCTHNYTEKTREGALKGVPLTTVFCPDCNSALKWETKKITINKEVERV